MTDEQRRALDLHVHCAVHANAGSGKTSVLTERFLRILSETNAPMESIVAITFTRAAAAEMRERIHAALRERNERSPDPRLGRWLRDLGQARIQTFHAFCSSLIRLATTELGLDADVRDMEEAESAVLVSDAVNAAMRAALRSDGPEREAAHAVFEDLSVDTARSIVTTVLRSRTLRDSVQEDRAAALARTLDDRLAALERLRHHVAMETADSVIATLRLAPPCPSFDVAIDAFTSCRASENITGIVSLVGEYFTDKGQVRANKIAKADKDLVPVRPTLPASVMKAVTDVLEMSVDPLRELRLLEIVDTLTRIGADAHMRYTNAKRERNALDFDDMISLVITLLENEDTAAAVRSGIRYIMVDEFQDTDPDQYEVLCRLIPALRGAAVTTPNVFIVGDDKQSIYGFRDADVRLFRKATTDIREANRRTSDDDGYRPLSRSFRMHQDLCASINQMCRSIFMPLDPSATVDATSFDVPYSDLVAGIEAPASDHLGTCARITVLDDEFDDVARTIVGILRGEHRFDVATRDRASGTWSVRPPHPGDIAVLVRKNDDVRAVASALRMHGVPFHVHGGRAFFSRPEVADIRALLRTCVDASDDLAAATLMRSPVLRCTDAEIAACAIAGRRTSLRDGLEILVREGRASAALVAAHHHFTAWAETILSMPLPTFIRTALDATRWHEAIAGEDRRDQILANVEKVLDIVRATIDGTGAGIADVIDALTPPDADREREGAVEVDGDAVQVMTIHASKGLEFNIVILAGLDGGSSPSGVVRSEAFGLTTSLAEKEVLPDALLAPVKTTPSVIHKANTIINDRRTVAETRRMLYVALTRAKMHVLCALPDPDAERSRRRSDVSRRMEAAIDALPPGRVRHIHPLTEVEPYVAQRSEPVVVDLTAPVAIPPPDLIAPSALLRSAADHDDAGASDGGSASGMAFGSAVHDALAAIIRTAHTMSVEDLTATIVRTLARHDIDRTAAGEAVEEILAVLDLDLVRSEAPSLATARVETRLAGALGDLVLHGILDVRLHRADGAIDVWDWKTNNVRSSDDVESLADVYAIQMCVYAWLCLRAYPDAPAVHTRLVFTKAARRGLAVVDHVRTWHRTDMAAMEHQIMAMAVPAA